MTFKPAFQDTNGGGGGLTPAQETKFNSIQFEATKNLPDATLLARENHTGTQGMATVDGLDAALDSKVDKVAGKSLSDTNYTQAEKDKLAGLESSRFKGQFTSVAALEAALPIGEAGDYANVDLGAGNDVVRYVWDTSDEIWVEQLGVSSQLTAAQIKQEYESNPDTNAFSDDEKQKLATAVENTDPRLSDAREWTAETVSQVEAEAGTATTRRAWTVQRVWQAVAAWWLSVTSTLGRTLVGRNTSAEMRVDLGLGTGATRDVGTDTGNVMEVGAGGWLGQASPDSYISGYPQDESQNVSQIYRRDSVDEGVSAFASSIHFATNDTWGRLRVGHNNQRAWIQGGTDLSGTGWTEELIHTGNTIVDTNGFVKEA